MTHIYFFHTKLKVKELSEKLPWYISMELLKQKNGDSFLCIGHIKQDERILCSAAKIATGSATS